MYVSGVVWAGSMLMFIGRGPWSIAVLPPVPGDGHGRADVVAPGGRGAAQAVLRLDGQVPARVVLEVVRPQDDELVVVRDHRRIAERGLARPSLERARRIHLGELGLCALRALERLPIW